MTVSATYDLKLEVTDKPAAGLDLADDASFVHKIPPLPGQADPRSEQLGQRDLRTPGTAELTRPNPRRAMLIPQTNTDRQFRSGATIGYTVIAHTWNFGLLKTI